MKAFFRKLFRPWEIQQERMEERWAKRAKVTRIVFEFENGIKNELVGDDADRWSKILYYNLSGYTQYNDEILKLEWKRVKN